MDESRSSLKLDFCHVGKRWAAGSESARSRPLKDLKRKPAFAQGGHHEAPPLVGRVRLIVAPAAQRDRQIQVVGRTRRFWMSSPERRATGLSLTMSPKDRDGTPVSASHHFSIATSETSSRDLPRNENRIASPTWIELRSGAAVARKLVVLAGSRLRISSCVITSMCG
jgi:hypothetical protein